MPWYHALPGRVRPGEPPEARLPAGRLAAMFSERVVTVSNQPQVELFVAQTTAPADETMLVIHGGPDWDHTYLRQPLAEIAGNRCIVMPDLRGCGRSTRNLPDDHYSPDAAVGDLLSLLEQFAAGQVDVLGFSYGGLLAQRLALAAPHRIRRLILASTTIVPVPADAYQDWPEARQHRAHAAEAWADPTLEGPALTRAATIAAAPASLWHHELLPAYRHRLEEVRFTAEWLRPLQAGTLPSALITNAPSRLAALAIPTLILHGRYDMTFPAVLAQQAAEAISTASTVILDQAGHMAHIDQPGAWLAAVSAFLD